jgi:hypothetical protein
MMDCFIHDLSLNRQYQSPEKFLSDIEALLRLRQQYPVVQSNLYCIRTISERPVTATQNLRDIARGADRNLRQQILDWLGKKGPFWDEDRANHADDYFECASQDVTDQGAGEAARRKLKGVNASTYSFGGGGFDYSPLSVQHGLVENPLGHYAIPNFWQLPQLQAALHNALPKPTNWAQTIAQAQQCFPDLYFVDYLLPRLQRETFSVYLAERIFELLGTLQMFMDSRNENGTYSTKNDEIIANHFSGSKAWFTDESISNKQHYESQLSFNVPQNPDTNTKLLCPWHGKIKTPQFRIHFSPWPLKLEDKKINIVYIGPKITKN